MIFSILQYVILAIIPGLLALWFFYLKDKHKEPAKEVLILFLLGAVVTIPAVMLEFAADLFYPYVQTIDTTVVVVSVFFIIAPIEELAKFTVVRLRIWKAPVFDEPFDGIIYTAAVGLGFATFENILAGIAEGTEVLLLRFMTVTILHAVAAGIMGYFIGLARFRKSGRVGLMAVGVVMAILVHGLYNLLLFMDSQLVLVFVMILLSVMVLVVWFMMGDANKLGRFLRKDRWERL